MFTLVFWKATLERAIKTAAQTAAALLATDAAGILEVDWVAAGSAAALAALLSVLTSLASGTVHGDGPSLGPERLDRT